MGFSLDQFFAELLEILAKEQKAAKTVRELSTAIRDAERYARQCGQLPRRNDGK